MLCECMLSASRVCKCFVHECKRLVELSAGPCSRLWKALCCNARKKDLASCADLCPMRSRVLRICACNRLTKDNKEEELVDVAPGWG